MTDADLDRELYARGASTLVASWEAYAQGPRRAAVQRHPGVTVAVFPHEPERSVYNNALLDSGLGRAARLAAVEAMEMSYSAAGVNRFAAWIREADSPMRRDLERRGYTLDTSTRAMGIQLDRVRGRRPRLDLVALDWNEYLRTFGLPTGLLAGGDHADFRLVVARQDGEDVATAMAFDHDGDRGIYNVGTLEHARRRGLATAVTALLLHDAAARGCGTASLQSTPMAERVYLAVGFRDLGRILEYVRQDSVALRAR